MVYTGTYNPDWVRKSAWWKWRIVEVPPHLWPLHNVAPILDVLMMLGIYESRSAARRAIRSGSVKIGEEKVELESDVCELYPFWPGNAIYAGSYRIGLVKGIGLVKV